MSSVALARARLGWSAEESVVVTLVGRHEARMLREVAPGRRLLLLTSGPDTPAVVGRLLVDAGCGAAVLTLLGDLGSEHESRIRRTALEWFVDPLDEVPALHVLAVEILPAVAGWRSSWVAGLPDDAFEHDGQLTRRDLRASALARLAPAPGQHLWDVGAGAGSVGIEWMRAHPSCRTTSVESNPRSRGPDRPQRRAPRRTRSRGRRGSRPRRPGRASGSGRRLHRRRGDPAAGVLDACLAALSPGAGWWSTA